MSNLWVSIENLRVGSLPKDSDGNRIGDCAALAILMVAREYSSGLKIDYPMIVNEIILEKQYHREDYLDESDFWFAHHCSVPQFMIDNLILKLTDISWISIRLSCKLPAWKIVKWCSNRDLMLLAGGDHILGLKDGIVYDTFNSRMELIDYIFLPESLYETINSDLATGEFVDLLKSLSK